jgi:hypothetical protein
MDIVFDHIFTVNVPLKFDDISTFRFGVLGLFIILMPNTVKKLKIEHGSTNLVCFFLGQSKSICM